MKLICPECRSPLTPRLRCRCGYEGFTIDGFPILLPAGAAALHRESDALTRRFGRHWRKRLAQLGAARFIDLARVVETHDSRRRVPVSTRELQHARRMSNQNTLLASQKPGREPDEPIRWIVARLKVLRPANLLDIGSGGGFLLDAVRRSGVVRRITGLEVDFLCLAVARQRARMNDRNHQLIGADARRMCLPDQSFDCVTSNFAYWHIDRFEFAATETFRVLRPGGMLLACETDHQEMVSGLTRLQSLDLARAVRLFGRTSELVDEFRRSGFHIKRSECRKVMGFRWRQIEAVRPR